MSATPDVNRVLVAGASGKTGRRVLDRLAGRALTVRGLTRSRQKADRLRDRGADEVVVGDLLDPDDAARAVADVDAVLTCVGSTPLQVYRAHEHVDGRGNRNLLEGALDAGASAFVMLSSLGTGDPPSNRQARLFRRVVGPVVAAKAETERALRDAPIRHTVLRPGMLLSYGPAGTRVADAGTGLWGAVTRGTVAGILAAAPFTPAAANHTFEVAWNPIQRGRGLAIDWRLPGEPT